MEHVINLLLEQDDVSWKTILVNLVEKEGMDPWDLDITLLTQKYLQAIREMQEHNLKISGKILLAAAFLLKIKSAHFVDFDIANLDKLICSTNEEIEESEWTDPEGKSGRDKTKYQLIPRNPQPRNRKVSVNDLIEALQKAIESKKRVLEKIRPIKYEMPKRKIDITEVIYDIYHKIVYYTNKEQLKSMTFTRLLPPRAGKTEKVYTFIPLLHLEQQRKIENMQKAPFDEIYVTLVEKGKLVKAENLEIEPETAVKN